MRGKGGECHARACSADPVSEELDVLHDVSNEDEVLESTDCVDVHVRVNEGHCSDLLVLKLPNVDLSGMGEGGGGRECKAEEGVINGGGRKNCLLCVYLLADTAQ